MFLFECSSMYFDFPQTLYIGNPLWVADGRTLITDILGQGFVMNTSF